MTATVTAMAFRDDVLYNIVLRCWSCCLHVTAGCVFFFFHSDSLWVVQVEKMDSECSQLQQELQDSKDQNELLEFRILELEVRLLPGIR